MYVLATYDPVGPLTLYAAYVVAKAPVNSIKTVAPLCKMVKSSHWFSKESAPIWPLQLLMVVMS